MSRRAKSHSFSCLGVPWGVAAVAAACAGVACGAAASSPLSPSSPSLGAAAAGGDAASAVGPFELRLRRHGRTLAAELWNRSATRRSVLCDVELQPSRLELASASGQPSAAFDSREIEKFDNTAYCARFRGLDPGGLLAVGEARFDEGSTGYVTSYGPFEFEGIEPGDYRATVVWESTLDRCFDEETGIERPVPNVWIGTVSSNSVEVTLR